MVELAAQREELCAQSPDDFSDLRTRLPARMVTDAGGISACGNQRSAWDARCRFDFTNSECR